MSNKQAIQLHMSAFSINRLLNLAMFKKKNCLSFLFLHCRLTINIEHAFVQGCDSVTN